MKMTWDELVSYAPPEPCRTEPLSGGELERIREMTMKKISTAPKKHARWPRRAAIAAAVAAALGCTALAAYTNGWFGFDRLFGSRAALVEPAVAHYDGGDISAPEYPDEERAAIDAGIMQVPDQAAVDGTAAAAETDGFRFTLESALASADTLYAIVRVDALTDDAAAALPALGEESEPIELGIFAINNAGSGHEKELKNGGMNWQLLETDGRSAHVLLTNAGGSFAPGDAILYQAQLGGRAVDLFEAPVPELLGDARTADLPAPWQSLTVTPIAVTLAGTSESAPDVALTLKGGAVFTLAGPGNDFAASAFGEAGSLTFSGTTDDGGTTRYTWTLAALIDPSELASVTIDGVTYPAA